MVIRYIQLLHLVSRRTGCDHTVPQTAKISIGHTKYTNYVVVSVAVAF